MSAIRNASLSVVIISRLASMAARYLRNGTDFPTRINATHEPTETYANFSRYRRKRIGEEKKRNEGSNESVYAVANERRWQVGEEIFVRSIVVVIVYRSISNTRNVSLLRLSHRSSKMERSCDAADTLRKKADRSPKRNERCEVARQRSATNNWVHFPRTISARPANLTSLDRYQR